MDEVVAFVCLPVAFWFKDGAAVGSVIEETVIDVVYRINWDVLILNLWSPDLWRGFDKEQFP